MPVSIYGDGSISGVSTLSTQLGVVTTSQLNVGTGGTVITTTASGLVGIGTDMGGGPASNYGFGVYRASGTGYVYTETAQSGASAGLRAKAGTADFTIFTTQGTGQLAVYDNTNTAERLRITAAGKIGINNNNPTYDLDILKTASGVGATMRVGANAASGINTASVIINNGGTGNASLDFKYESAATPRASIYVYQSNQELRFDTAGTERVRIDSSGRVTKPYQLWIAGSPTNTGGSGVFNSFATANFATPVGLSFVTDRITVPIAGVYLITYNTICDETSVRRDTQILINGTAITNQLSENSTTGYHYRSASLAVKLSANDYIQFSNQDWYNAASTNDPWRTASVYLLG